MVYKMRNINLALNPHAGAAPEGKPQLGQQCFAPVMARDFFFFFSLYNYS